MTFEENYFIQPFAKYFIIFKIILDPKEIYNQGRVVNKESWLGTDMSYQIQIVNAIDFFYAMFYFNVVNQFFLYYFMFCTYYHFEKR